MKPQAIFVDLDDTLIPHGMKSFSISLENELALKNAQKKGIYVVIATGRSYKDALITQNKIRYNKYGDYLISSNSASIDFSGEPPKNLLNNEISLEEAKKLIEYGKKKNYLIKLSQDPRYFGHAKFGLINYVFKKYGHEIIGYWHLDLNSEGAKNKIGFVPQMLSLKKIQKIVEQMRIDFPNLEIVASGPGRFIEINKKNISKAKGLKFLAKKLDLDLQQCVALGDSNNDVEMFKVVGIPIVMKNAKPEVKKYAKFETDDTKKSGVAKGIASVYKLKEKDKY